jgi:hypothetical protein
MSENPTMPNNPSTRIRVRRKDGKTLCFGTTQFPNSAEAVKAFKAIHTQSIQTEGWEIIEPEENQGLPEGV